MAQGEHAKVPVLMGANKDGGSIFQPMIDAIIPGQPTFCRSAEDVNRLLTWTFGADDVDKVLAVYPIAQFSSASGTGMTPYQMQAQQIMRDITFRCSDRKVAGLLSAQNIPVYLYTFSFNFGPTLNTVVPLGDLHGSELPFVFDYAIDTIDLLPLSGNATQMTEVRTCMWAAVAHKGNPNAPTDGSVVPGCDNVHGNRHVPNWPLYGADDREFYSFDWSFGSYPKPKAIQANNIFPDDEFPSDLRCDMWDSLTLLWHPEQGATSVV